MDPTRARPVPFWRHGFLPLPLTLARFFVWCVPRRAAAFSWTTDSQMRSVFTRPPNTSSLTSTEPTLLFWLSTTSNCMSALCPAWAEQARPLLLALLGFLHLRNLDLLGGHGLPDDHVAARLARDAALHDQQVVVRVDADDFEVADRDAPAAHAAR